MGCRLRILQAKWHVECQWESGAVALTYREAVGLETLEAQEHPARPGCLRQQAILVVLAAPSDCNQNISLSFVFKPFIFELVA
jgi:hypothetical protein